MKRDDLIEALQRMSPHDDVVIWDGWRGVEIDKVIRREMKTALVPVTADPEASRFVRYVRDDE